MNDRGDAQAAVTILEDRDLVAVLERFEFGDPGPDKPSIAPPTRTPSVRPEQRAALDAVLAHLERDHSFHKDAVAGVVLLGRDHNRLAVYTQWRTPDSGPPVEVPAPWSVADVLLRAEPTTRVLETRTYTVEFTLGHRQPRHARRLGGPLVHFGMFSFPPAEQDVLLGLARQHAPGSLVTPGLTSVNFHRSLDRTRALNLGVWESFDNFMKLLDQPGFTDEQVYWEGVAQFHPDYFDVAHAWGPAS
ncbi:hypothetical protein [Catenuloplanes atrovinosus]|uniref:ABM domain-containing protein n=1 Tax=Catenuloplanes atrovinosus TaxID=137266 RepID=A0AAE3YNT2_9ACTN|nr:hypothetical protein [Catenuloplanes atrovinosus]MDR7275628.1 hypothetical protein [Catenuloplanes atrovinosus]